MVRTGLRWAIIAVSSALLIAGLYAVLPSAQPASVSHGGILPADGGAPARGFVRHFAQPLPRAVPPPGSNNSRHDRFPRSSEPSRPHSKIRRWLHNVIPPLPFLAFRARTKLLDHPRRRRIMQEIKKDPGIRLTELGRHLGISKGVLAFHLRSLEGDRLVIRRTCNRRTYLFPAESHEPLPVSPLTTRKGQVLATIRSSAGLGERELAQALDMNPRTAGYHLRGLRALGLAWSTRVGHRFLWLAIAESPNYSILDHKAYEVIGPVRPRREEDAAREALHLARHIC